jgi:hypothetical protein
MVDRDPDVTGTDGAHDAEVAGGPVRGDRATDAEEVGGDDLPDPGPTSEAGSYL